ncbi:MAG: hypothetical protein OXU88_06725 [Gammaproteobacteria bacterium]|nr:hypothetical protein [Gammaproteobacteria bacterium]
MRLFHIITIISTFALAGCATSKQTYTADGRIGHSIDCSGGFATWGSCYEKAGGLCGAKGYDVLEKIGEKDARVSGSAYGFGGGTVHIRNMIIRCKEGE